MREQREERKMRAYVGGKEKERPRQWGSYSAKSYGAKKMKNLEFMQGNRFANQQFEILN
jgi:hypothetical protein